MVPDIEGIMIVFTVQWEGGLWVGSHISGANVLYNLLHFWGTSQGTYLWPLDYSNRLKISTVTSFVLAY